MSETPKTLTIGPADNNFKLAFTLPAFALELGLAAWTYFALPISPWRPVIFLAMFLVGALIYFNLGVWIHELLHVNGFRGTVNEKQSKVYFVRRFLIGMHGWYTVDGPIEYPVLRRALLGPLWLVVTLLLIALAGSFFLPKWWFPAWATMAIVAAADMLHDFYWIYRTREIGSHAVYFDHGSELEVVWKD